MSSGLHDCRIRSAQPANWRTDDADGSDLNVAQNKAAVQTPTPIAFATCQFAGGPERMRQS